MVKHKTLNLEVQTVKEIWDWSVLKKFRTAVLLLCRFSDTVRIQVSCIIETKF